MVHALISTSIYKVLNKTQKYHNFCLCSNSWHMHLYVHRYSYRLLIRKGPCMLLPSAPRQVPRFLQVLSSLDAETFQIFRWKYFHWTAESFEHMVGKAQMWSKLSSVSYILLNATGASFWYICLTELREAGSWLLLRATGISFLFRKYWECRYIFFSSLTEFRTTTVNHHSSLFLGVHTGISKQDRVY